MEYSSPGLGLESDSSLDFRDSWLDSDSRTDWRDSDLDSWILAHDDLDSDSDSDSDSWIIVYADLDSNSDSWIFPPTMTRTRLVHWRSDLDSDSDSSKFSLESDVLYPGMCTCEASSRTGPRYSSLKMSRDTPRIVLSAFTHSASTLEKSSAKCSMWKQYWREEKAL